MATYAKDDGIKHTLESFDKTFETSNREFYIVSVRGTHQQLVSATVTCHFYSVAVSSMSMAAYLVFRVYLDS